MSDLLQIENVGHRYQTTTTALPVLNQVNLTVDNDSVVAIVGESGCGKTSLGRIVSGLVQPSSGQVKFHDRDIWQLRGADWRTYRRSVQIAHQDPYASLNPGLSVGDALRPGLVRHKIVPRSQVTDEILRLLDLVGLDADPAFLRRFPHQLSGGQRQRLAIARAVSLRPQLIVADEPTSMLDVSIRVAILDLLLSLQREQGLAYLFISHDFGVVRYFARGGRIVVMFFGEVVEEGPAEEVLTGARHPYTYLLLESIPLPDPRAARRRRDSALAEGEQKVDRPPSPVGCIFSNRCPFVADACRKARPELVEVGPGHRSACLFPERVPRLTTALRGGSEAPPALTHAAAPTNSAPTNSASAAAAASDAPS